MVTRTAWQEPEEVTKKQRKGKDSTLSLSFQLEENTTCSTKGAPLASSSCREKRRSCSEGRRGALGRKV